MRRDTEIQATGWCPQHTDIESSQLVPSKGEEVLSFLALTALKSQGPS